MPRWKTLALCRPPTAGFNTATHSLWIGDGTISAPYTLGQAATRGPKSGFAIPE